MADLSKSKQLSGARASKKLTYEEYLQALRTESVPNKRTTVTSHIIENQGLFTAQDIADISAGKKRPSEIRNILGSPPSFDEVMNFSGKTYSGTMNKPFAKKLTYKEYLQELNANSIPIPQIPVKRYTQDQIATAPSPAPVPRMADFKRMEYSTPLPKVQPVPKVGPFAPKTALPRITDMQTGPNAEDWLSKNTMAGIGGFNKGLAQTADFILPNAITPKPIQKTLDYYKNFGTQQQEQAAQVNKETGTETLGNLYQGTVSALPNAALAIATAGASTAPQIGQSAASTGIIGTISNALQSLAKNPMFWSSFAQTTGSTYEQAKQEGANEAQAQATAIISGLLNAGVEVGGGIETFNPSNTGVRQWVKSMFDEGKEEVVQGVVENLTKKALYAQNTPYASTTQDAVINPVTAGQQFLGGAVAGGILGAGQTLAANALHSVKSPSAIPAEQTIPQPIPQAPQPIPAAPQQVSRATANITPQPVPRAAEISQPSLPKAPTISNVKVYPELKPRLTLSGSPSADINPTITPKPIPKANAVEQPATLPYNPFGKNTVGSAESAFPRVQEVSKVRANTIENSPMFTQAEKELLNPTDFQYDVISEKQSLAEAKQRLEVDFAGEVADLPNKSGFNGTDTDTAMGILETYLQEARKTGDYSKVKEWSKMVQQKGTEGGQLVQAFAKYSRTPEGAVVKGQQVVNSVEREIKKANPRKIETVDSETKAIVDTIEQAEPDAAMEMAESFISNTPLGKNIRKAANEIGIDLDKIIRQSKGDKDAALQSITDYLIKESGVTGNDANRLASDIYSKYTEILKQKTDAKLKSMFREVTPKGQKSTYQKVIELINMGAYDRENIRDIIKQKNGIPVLESSDVSNITHLMEQSQGLPEGSYDRRLLEARAAQIIANKIPPTFRDKLISGLMDSMLGNFRTLISRNAGGNLLFAIPESIKEVPAAIIDKAVSFKTGERTRTLPSISKAKSYGEGLKKGLTEQVADYKNKVSTAPSGIANDIDINRRVFENNVANELDRLVKTGLAMGDRPFYEATYAKRMTELKKIRDMGKLGKEFKNGDFDQIADMLAKVDALEATFQNKGLIVSGFNEIKKGLGHISKASLGVDILGQSTMPFVKTPANIFERSLEYSPLGIAKNVLKTGEEVATGTFDQRRFSDETARNLIGIGLASVANSLLKNGIITGSLDKDKDVRAAQYQAGMQPYSVKFGDNYYAYDWVPVVGPALAAGADYAQAAKHEEGTVNRIAAGAKAAIKTSAGMSAMQGTQRLMGGYDLASGLFDTVAGGTGQFVPSLVRQTASVGDQYARETYDPNPLIKQGKTLMNSVPGLRQTLPVKIDTSGNPVLQNQGRGLASKAFENYINPGKYTQLQSSKVSDELMRLYRDNGYKTQFLQTAPKNFEYVTGSGESKKSETINLTSNEYVSYQKRMGEKSASLMTDILNSYWYKNASDYQKTQALTKINAYSNALAKRDLLKSRGLPYQLDSEFSKIEQAEKNGVDFSKYYSIKQNADSNGNGSISKDELITTLNENDLSWAQKAYIYMLQNPKAKNNPYDDFQKTGIPQSAFSRYYQALLDVESTKRPNGKTIPNSLERNRRKALMDAGATLQEANAYIKAMYD